MDVSIVIPCYNDASYLKITLESIAAQTVEPREVLVIDDGSTDESVDVALQFPFVRLLRNEKNRGVVYTTNRGFFEAKGKWVALGSSNDPLLPRFLEVHQENLRDFPGIALSCAARVDFLDGESHGVCLSAGIPRQKLYGRDSLALIQSHPFVAYTATALMERSVLLKEGVFDPELGCIADWFLVHKIFLTYPSAYTPEPVSCLRYQSTSYSNLLTDPVRRAPLYLKFMEKVSREDASFQEALRESGLLFELDGMGQLLLFHPQYQNWALPILRRIERGAHQIIKTPFFIKKRG